MSFYLSYNKQQSFWPQFPKILKLSILSLSYQTNNNPQNWTMLIFAPRVPVFILYQLKVITRLLKPIQVLLNTLLVLSNNCNFCPQKHNWISNSINRSQNYVAVVRVSPVLVEQEVVHIKIILIKFNGFDEENC